MEGQEERREGEKGGRKEEGRLVQEQWLPGTPTYNTADFWPSVLSFHGTHAGDKHSNLLIKIRASHLSRPFIAFKIIANIYWVLTVY